MRYLLGTFTLLSLLHLSSSPTWAAFSFFSERSSFEQTNPGLPVEDFEEANVGSGLADISPPLDSTSNNDFFAPGDILEGIAFGISDNLKLRVNDSIPGKKTQKGS